MERRARQEAGCRAARLEEVVQALRKELEQG